MVESLDQAVKLVNDCDKKASSPTKSKKGKKIRSSSFLEFQKNIKSKNNTKEKVPK